MFFLKNKAIESIIKFEQRNWLQQKLDIPQQEEITEGISDNLENLQEELNKQVEQLQKDWQDNWNQLTGGGETTLP